MIQHPLTWAMLTVGGISIILNITVALFLYYHLCCPQCQCCKPCQKKEDPSIELSVASTSPYSSDAEQSVASSNPKIMSDLSINSTSPKIQKPKRRKKKVVIKRYFRYSTIVTVTCFTISSILVYQHVLTLIMKHDSMYFDVDAANKESKAFSILNILSVIARLSLLILLNGRLYYTFDGTVYKINKYTFYTLNGIIIVIPGLIVIALFIRHYLAVFFLFIMLFLIINILILLYSFNQRLMKLTVSSITNEMILKKNEKESKSKKQRRKEVKLHKHEQALIDLVTRNTLLILMVIIIGNIPSVFATYLIIKGMRSFNEFCYLGLMAVTLQLLNVICIALLYHFCDKYYNVLCKCNKCKIKCCTTYCGHNGCLNICTGIARKRIINDTDSNDIICDV